MSRRLFDADVHVRLCNRVCVLLGQRVVQTRVYQPGGTLLPRTQGLGKLPVRHFVSAILFARYLAGYFDLDALRSLRYLFVRTDRLSLGTQRRRANCPRGFGTVHLTESDEREIFHRPHR